MARHPGTKEDDKQLQRRWPLLGAALAFVAAGLLGSLTAYSVELNNRQAREIQARQLASAAAHDLGERLDRALSASNAVIAVLRQGQGRIDDFEVLARELINLFGGITALQLAPEGTITRVEPLVGNERVIGFSPVRDPIQGPEARRVIERRQLGLTGPFELRQGGVGVVGRNPVFLKDPGGGETFWGLVQVLIRVPDLLIATRLSDVEEAGYRYELWRRLPGQGERHVFSRSSNEALSSPVEVKIPVPDGEWMLSVGPERSWYSPNQLLLDAAAVFLVALCVGLAAYLGLRQPQLLRREVAERTRELRDSEAKYRELVDSVSCILLRCDRQGRVVFLNEFGQAFFGYASDEIVGRPVMETIVPAVETGGRDLQALVAEIFAQPESYASSLNENVRKNGERVWVLWRNRVQRDADGAVVGILSVGIDVTEWHRADGSI